MSLVRANRFLIDAEEFKKELTSRMSQAQYRILVQVMTFECDEVGKWLLEVIQASKAKEKKLVVDAYSLVNINDGLAFGGRYYKDETFKEEVDATRSLLKGKKTQDVEIHLTNRMGWNMAKYPFRNHKKLIVIDEVLYLGGLNFSDHNFEWHDFMVRIDNPEIVESAARDIMATIAGKNQNAVERFQQADLFYFNGNRSKKLYREVFDLIKSAKQSIKIVSPYVSDPLLSELRGVRVPVEILTPEKNNKGIMTKLLLGAARNRDWDIHLFQEKMSHCKALLVDDETLMIGSSNFDFVSYELEQEIILVTKDRELIEEFIERVWRADLSKSTPYSATDRAYLGARMAIFVARFFIRILGLFKKG